jgi:hypothetical protein
MVESLVLIVPEAEADAVRIALDEAGYGPNCLSVPMRGKVRVDDPDQATHWGSHWWAGEELDAVMAIVEQAAPGAVVVHSSETMGFELFDQQAGDYIYVPVDPRLIDGLTVGLGELATPQRGLPYAPIVAASNGGQGREAVASAATAERGRCTDQLGGEQRAAGASAASVRRWGRADSGGNAGPCRCGRLDGGCNDQGCRHDPAKLAAVRYDPRGSGGVGVFWRRARCESIGTIYYGCPVG